MSKAGNFFRSFFKLIFVVGAVAAAVIALLCMLAPFYSFSYTLDGTVLMGLDLTGFALAFNKPFTVSGSLVDPAEVGSLGENSIPTIVTMVLIIVGAVLILLNLFPWKFGKISAILGGLCLVAAAILALLTIQLNSDLKDLQDALDQVIGDPTIGKASYGLGAGAISTGIFGLVSGACAIISGALNPKH